MSSLVTIRRCATLPEALICKGLLQSRGIDVSLSNYAHASIDWWSVPAFNGVGLLLPAAHYEEARSIIEDAVTNASDFIDEIHGSYEAPPAYGRAAVWFYWLNFFGATLVAYIVIGLAINAILPDPWIDWLMQHAAPEFGGAGSYYYLRPGDQNAAVLGNDFNFEGAMFLLIIFLVFLTDRLSTRNTEVRDEAP